MFVAHHATATSTRSDCVAAGCVRSMGTSTTLLGHGIRDTVCALETRCAHWRHCVRIGDRDTVCT
eukprot:1511575-Rhodomonas_salina.1